MPKLIAMWRAHDTYVKRSGTRKLFVFEPCEFVVLNRQRK